MKKYIDIFTGLFSIIVSFCLVMPGMPAFGNTYLSPPALNELVFQRSMQDAEGIPEEVLDEASSIDDIIAYIWQQNIKGIHPLGINLELYAEQHGQFALYYLIKDLRKYFQGLKYFIDPSPHTLGERVNKITGKKLFKRHQLKTDVFFHVKEVFGRLCAKGQLGKCKGLGDFLDVIEGDTVLSEVHLAQITGAVDKRNKFADLLGVDEAKIPKDWDIPKINLSVKQLKALRNLFKPKVIDGSIKDYNSPDEFKQVIQKDKILSDASINELMRLIRNRRLFAALIGVEAEVLSAQWKTCFGIQRRSAQRAIATAP